MPVASASDSQLLPRAPLSQSSQAPRSLEAEEMTRSTGLPR